MMQFDVLARFQLDAPAVSCERYGCGHINETYLVVTESGRRYILQKISNRAFPDVAGLQENIAAVTEFLHTQTSDPYGALTLIPTDEGKMWLHWEENSDWRVYDFIEGAVCLQKPETAEDFYQSAIAFGTFQQQLAGFPAHTLHETIKNFHNTPDRFRIFKEVLAKDVMNRAKDVQPEIEFALSHEEFGGRLMGLLKEGKLPLRVTHNDTKINNVLFDPQNGEALVVIDLDTVMPGLVGHDFGDAIRFAANKCEEDCPDASKAGVDMEVFRAFAEGFLEQTANTLTPNEINTLALSCLTLTAELSTRFLADYILGDPYFKIKYPEHNLVRTRCQIALAKDMQKHLPEMEQMVRECVIAAHE